MPRNAAEQSRIWRAANPEKAKAIREREKERQRRWRATNPEKAYAQQKAWVAANRERLAERRRELYRERLEEARAKSRENLRALRERDPVRFMLQAARARAKALGLPFDLTKADVSVPEYCPVLPWVRLQFGFGAGRPTPGSPSLDRVRPELGYVRGNVRVISYRANTLRSDATVEELECVLAYARDAKERA